VTKISFETQATQNLNLRTMHHSNMAKIEEQPDGDNLVFKLIVAKREVCYATMVPYGILLDIQTISGEEGKGYAKKLLAYIEKTVRAHNAVGLTQQVLTHVTLKRFVSSKVWVIA
jgi:hypothetical protein